VRRGGVTAAGDGADVHGSPAAHVLQGRGQGHEGGGGGASGKVGSGAAHRIGRAPVGWRSDGGGWLSRVGEDSGIACRPVRGRGR
jgi:hypothetical protein